MKEGQLSSKEISSFLDSPTRKMRHAGQSYPRDAEELRKRLDSFFMPEHGGPGFPDPAGTRAEKMVGLVAPHIDLNAGGACFAHAYKSAAEAQVPQTWIVLGTGHDFIENCFALTVKDFETPLGQVRCDTAICASTTHVHTSPIAKCFFQCMSDILLPKTPSTLVYPALRRLSTNQLADKI